MATPGQFNYDLEGQQLSFVNSDDMKIKIEGQPVTILRLTPGGVETGTGGISLSGELVSRKAGVRLEGQPVTVEQTAAGIAAPGTGTLSVDESSPVIPNRPAPGTGSLAIGEESPVVNQPISLASLALSTSAPSVNRGVFPTTVSVGLSGELTERRTGLKLESSEPSLQFGLSNIVPTSAVTLDSSPPGALVEAPGDTVRSPSTGALNMGESTPEFGYSLVVPVGALSVAGQTPSVDPVVYPLRGVMQLIGQTVLPDDGEGKPTVEIGGPFEPGTFILNPDAEIYTGKSEICSRTGFKQKVGRVAPDAYNVEAREDSRDKFHPADIPHKVKRELHRGSPRPDDSGKETFIEDAFPNGVNPEDY